jgi:ubiquinone/menaquinone biosynthesis C-methylase UbiE
MPSIYENSDVHLRYDRGRRLSVGSVACVRDFLQRKVRAPVRLAVDLGCGTGRFTALLAEALSAPVLGVEPSANMRAMAERKGLRGDVRFAGGSAEAIPLDNGAADLVFFSQVWHHLADPAAALREVSRVLAAGAHLVVRQSTQENLDSYFYQRFFPSARAADERRLPARSGLVGLVAACGFRPGDRETCSYAVAASANEYVERVATRAYSDLEVIGDADFRSGLDALRRHAADHPDFPREEEVDLFEFERV